MGRTGSIRISKLALTVGLLLTIAPRTPAQPPRPSEKTETEFKRARTLLDQGQSDKAVQALKTVLVKNPQFINRLDRRGVEALALEATTNPAFRGFLRSRAMVGTSFNRKAPPSDLAESIVALASNNAAKQREARAKLLQVDGSRIHSLGLTLLASEENVPFSEEIFGVLCSAPPQLSTLAYLKKPLKTLSSGHHRKLAETTEQKIWAELKIGSTSEASKRLLDHARALYKTPDKTEDLPSFRWRGSELVSVAASANVVQLEKARLAAEGSLAYNPDNRETKALLGRILASQKLLGPLAPSEQARPKAKEKPSKPTEIDVAAAADEAIRDNDTAVATILVAEFSQTPNARELKTLKEALKAKNATLRWTAAAKLAEASPDDDQAGRSMVEAISTLASRRNNPAARSALDTVGRLPRSSKIGAKTLPQLERLAIQDRTESESAFRALGRFGTAAQSPTLIRYLSGSETDYPNAALESLREIAIREKIQVEKEDFETILFEAIDPKLKGAVIATLNEFSLTADQKQQIKVAAGAPGEIKEDAQLSKTDYVFALDKDLSAIQAPAKSEKSWKTPHSTRKEFVEAFNVQFARGTRPSGDPIVYQNPRSGRVSVPECDSEFLRSFGAHIGSKALETVAEDLAQHNRKYVEFRRGELPISDLEDLASNYDAAAGYLLRNLSPEPDPEESPSDANRNKDEIALTKKILQRAHNAEQGFFHGQGPVPLASLAAIQKASASIVVVLEQSGGDLERLGTGFIYRGRVITASHLFTQDGDGKSWKRFWKDGSFFADKLRVAFIGEDSTFEKIGVKVDGKGFDFWPEWDTACLRLDRESLSDEHAARISAPPAYEVGGEGKDLTKGIVYAVAALELLREGLVPAWIPAGRIIFPERVERPSDSAEPEDAEIYELFARALRIHLFGCCQNCSDNELTTAYAEVLDAYDLNDPDDDGYFFLRRPAHTPERISQFAKDSDFATHRKIRYFGTDLGTQGGASGAPIFRLPRVGKRQPVLVGMHVFGIPDAETAGGNPPTIHRFGRSIPFVRLQKQLDKFIDSHP